MKHSTANKELLVVFIVFYFPSLKGPQKPSSQLLTDLSQVQLACLRIHFQSRAVYGITSRKASANANEKLME